jgi:hypothetical protein
MSSISAIAALLACPRCDKTPLDFQGDAPYCAGCHVRFEPMGGLPWLFAEPLAARHEWRGRWHLALRAIELDVQRCEQALERPTTRPTTRERLTHRIDALRLHATQLGKLLAPLDVNTAAASYASYLALRTRLPPDQGLMTYYANVHRDWNWGGTENAASLELVLGALASHGPSRMLVLGSGAGRLTYDLHQATSAATTIGLDFNPLLMLIADRIARGETLTMHEFPMAPRTAAEHAVLRELAAPETARAGLHWMVADTHRAPFAAGAFDTVVTPWLIDILPEELEGFAARINRLLAPGGVWINFGSLSFHGAHPAVHYSLEECIEIVADVGFSDAVVDSRRIPYMCSPASRHGRQEEVVTWACTKREAVKKVPRYEALPDWLVRGNSPVPQSESIRTQAMATQVHGFLMALIDGKRSLQDIAKIAAERQLVPPAEAEATIRNFLIKLYDEGRRLSYR